MTDERLEELKRELADLVSQINRWAGRAMEISDRLERELASRIARQVGLGDRLCGAPFLGE